MCICEIFGKPIFKNVDLKLFNLGILQMFDFQKFFLMNWILEVGESDKLCLNKNVEWEN